MRTSGLVLQLRTCYQASYYLTDHILLFFPFKLPSFAVSLAITTRTSATLHQMNHTLLAKLKAKVQLIDKLAYTLCV